MDKETNKLEDEIYTEDQAQKEEKPKKRWPNILIKSLVFFVIFALVGLALFGNKFTKETEQSKVSWLSDFSLLGQIKNLAQSSDRKLKGEEADRINILLLGIGGKNHEGGYLNDTNIILSIQPSTKKVAMISVPRDLTVPIEGYGWRKINAIGSFAEKENPGSGGLASSQSFSQIFNTPIDYYLRVDFDGFAKMIDELGGVDIDVENTLDDYSYPVLGMEDAKNYYARYEHLHIDKGLQHMDGSLALKYARSRHGVNGEGSDFARAKRQQKIIEAVKDKLFSMDTLFSPTKISGLINTYQDNVNTNLQVWEMIKLYEMVKDVKKDQIINKVLDNSPSGLLMDKRGEDNAYILVPRSGDFSQIQYLISNVFNDAPAEEKKKVLLEKASIEIRNGTWVNGLASKVSTDLETIGFEVTGIGNASQRNYQRSVIYDLTGGTKTESLNLLKEKTKANITSDLPQWLTNDLAKEQKLPDFVLVLGQVADATASGLTNPTE